MSGRSEGEKVGTVRGVSGDLRRKVKVRRPGNMYDQRRKLREERYEDTRVSYGREGLSG